MDTEYQARRYFEGRLMALRNNRYSWWTHGREIAQYFLPRRYRWLITPNLQDRGSPINQSILDSTGTLCARNLASGIMSGISSPSKPWFKLKIGRIDSTQTSPVSLWLYECERLLMLIFHESNFYNALAVMYFDLVIFGTGVILIYEDFDDVIRCYNPCFGEFYVDIDGKYRPTIFYREFTMTIGALVDEFGPDACSPAVIQSFEQADGSGKTREIIVAHAIEPNSDGRSFGIDKSFAFREVYWEWGGTQTQQTGTQASGFLRKKGYHSQPNVTVRWDLVSNDPYGRSPAMDALGDVKQLQIETKRKGQSIDKNANPPMVADAQLKNMPASLLPGGITYVNGMMSNKTPGFQSVYDKHVPINEITEDLAEVRDRIKKIFFNDLLQIISQYETRSNVSATEIDARRAESLVMLGPALERVSDEGLDKCIDRVFDVAFRAAVLPKPPPEIEGQMINVEYMSMLALAQSASAASGIERSLGLAGNLAGIDPSVLDNIDIDFAFAKYAHLLNNDPKMIRSPEQLIAIRQQRQQQQAMQQKVDMAEKLAAGAKTLSETDVGDGRNALQQMGM